MYPRLSRALAEVGPSFGMEYCHHIHGIDGLFVFRVFVRGELSFIGLAG